MSVSRRTIVIRPIDTDDLDAALDIERTYAAAHAVAPAVDAAALRHYGRSGHAFVAIEADTTLGLVLAHAVWDGARPVVRVSRLVARADDADVLARLMEAVVKSAYDAAVYDLVAEVPDGDQAGQRAVEGASFTARPIRRFERVLGSRAAAAASPPSAS